MDKKGRYVVHFYFIISYIFFREKVRTFSRMTFFVVCFFINVYYFSLLLVVQVHTVYSSLIRFFVLLILIFSQAEV